MFCGMPPPFYGYPPYGPPYNPWMPQQPQQPSSLKEARELVKWMEQIDEVKAKKKAEKDKKAPPAAMPKISFPTVFLLLMVFSLPVGILETMLLHNLGNILQNYLK
jgi:hypothetical protein